MNHFVVLTITTDVDVFIGKLYILVLTFLMHFPEICTVKPVYKGQPRDRLLTGGLCSEGQKLPICPKLYKPIFADV